MNTRGQLISPFRRLCLCFGLLGLAAALLIPVEAHAAASPNITTQPQSQSIIAGSNVEFTVVAGGQTPLFYQWLFDGTNLANSTHIGGVTNSTLTVSNVLVGDMGNYKVVVSNSHGSATSSNATLTVVLPATIATQPTNESVLVSSNVSFAATVAGTAVVNCRWYFGGTALTNGGGISGSATTNLNLANVQSNEAGNYQLVVTNNYGSATSAVATLTVLFPPGIASQPTNQSVLLGNSVSFIAVTTGSLPLNCQWYFNGTPLTDGIGINGSATPNLNLPDVQTNQAGNYQLVVTNNYGSATSSIATLIVLSPPSITIQPTNQAAPIGSTVVFSSGATSQSLMSYQWVKDGGAVIDGGRISGADTPTLTISNLQMSDTGDYEFEASNTNGTSASAPASLMIVPVVARGGYSSSNTNVPPAATNATAISGGYEFSMALKRDGTVVGWGTDTSGQTDPPAGLSNVTAIATGFNFGLALKANGTVLGWGDDSYGQTNIPVELSNVVAIAAGWYYGLALKADGTVTGWGDNYFGQTSIPAGLSNVVALAAGTASSLALKSDGTVIGWGFDQDGEINIPAGLSNVVAIAQGSYSGLALKSDGTVVGWGYGGGVNVPAGLSNVVAISVGELFGLGLRSDATVITWGSDYGESSISIGLSNVVSIAAGRLHALALVQDPAVEVAPTIWWQGQTNQTVPSGQTLLLRPIISGSKPMSFQWYFNGSPLTGQTNSWLVVQSIQPGQAGNYQFSVSNNYGSVTSQVAAVIESPGILNQPVGQFSLAGGSIAFNSTAAGSGTLFYQWYFNGSPLADDGRVSGSTTANLTIANVQSNDVGSYELIVTNSYGSATSQVATFTLLVPAAITVPPVSQSILMTSNATFSVSVAGTPPPSCQWYFNGALLTDEGRVTGSSTTNLVISDVQPGDAGPYQFVATNNCGAATSAVVTLTVLIPAAISGQPSNQASLINSNASFTGTATGTSPLAYQWYFNNTPLVDGGRVSGSATNNLTILNLQTNDAGAYQLIVTNNYGSATSVVATLTVLVPAAIIVQPTNQVVLLSNNVSFTVGAMGTAPLNYHWYSNGVGLVNGGRINGATSPTLAISNVQTNDSAAYYAIVANNYGSSTSLVATLTVHVPAIITSQPANQSVMLGSNVTFSAAVIGEAPLNLQWYFGGAPLTDGGRVSGSATTNLTITNIQTTDAGPYQLVATNNFGSATSVVATLTVLLTPAQITGQPASQAVLPGSNVTFTVTATGSLLNYQWYFDGTPLTDGGRISGSATPALTISNVQTNDAGSYVAAVTNLSSSATSRMASLTPQSVLAPSVRYVSLANTNALSPYLAWSTAATNIQDAVDAAVAGDTIMVTDGVFAAGGRAVYGAATNRVTVDKAVTVESVNGSASTFIVGNLRLPYIRCVYLTNGATLIGFTLTNGGTAISGDAYLVESGAGIWSESSSAVVSNCVAVGNRATADGGGAFRGTLFNCLLTNNTASAGGGSCSNILINCTLVKNSVSGQGLGGGGAVYGTLSNCLLVANVAGSGGGAYSSMLNNCVLSNNAASNGGGVYLSTVYNSLISSNRGSVYGGGAYSNILYNCTLTNNYAEWGGAAYLSTLNQCLIIGNRAQNYGGGIYNSTANNSLIAANTATSGTATYGGILKSCTVVSNITPAGAQIVAVNGSAITNSIIYDNYGGNIINTKAMLCVCSIPYIDLHGVTNAPLFVNEAGGDFRLQSNSPCINSGNNACVSGTNDLDGNPRIVGGTVDIGAYEYQSPASVVSYAWLQQYGLPTDGTVDYTNLDGTRFNVYQDWIAGLNPTNPASVLAMQAPVSTNNSFGITVTWQSVTSRIYYLQRATDLMMQPAFSSIQSNIVGQAGSTGYTDTTATNNGPYIYRVGVQ